MTTPGQFKALCVILGCFALLFVAPPVGIMVVLGLGGWRLVRLHKSYKRKQAEAARARYIAWRGHPANQRGLSIEEANAYRRTANQQKGPQE